jgi:hypothetical protein
MFSSKSSYGFSSSVYILILFVTFIYMVWVILYTLIFCIWIHLINILHIYMKHANHAFFFLIFHNCFPYFVSIQRTSFNYSFRTGLFEANFLFSFIWEMSWFLLYLWKAFSLYLRSHLGVSFFQQPKSHVGIISGLPCCWWEICGHLICFSSLGVILTVSKIVSLSLVFRSLPMLFLDIIDWIMSPSLNSYVKVQTPIDYFWV